MTLADGASSRLTVLPSAGRTKFVNQMASHVGIGGRRRLSKRDMRDQVEAVLQGLFPVEAHAVFIGVVWKVPHRTRTCGQVSASPLCCAILVMLAFRD